MSDNLPFLFFFALFLFFFPFYILFYLLGTQDSMCHVYYAMNLAVFWVEIRPRMHAFMTSRKWLFRPCNVSISSRFSTEQSRYGQRFNALVGKKVVLNVDLFHPLDKAHF